MPSCAITHSSHHGTRSDSFAGFARCARRQARLERRTDAALSGPHCRGRRSERIRARRRRGEPRAGACRRRAHRRRRGREPAVAGHSRCAQGRIRHARLAQHRWLSHARELRQSIRRRRRRAPGARGHGHAGQDQYGRVRHGLVERKLVLRPGEEPVGHARRARRLVGRRGGRGGRASRAGRHRNRHRRLDPSAGGVHRHRRHQADVWPRVALRDDRVRFVARPGRPVRS